MTVLSASPFKASTLQVFDLSALQVCLSQHRHDLDSTSQSLMSPASPQAA